MRFPRNPGPEFDPQVRNVFIQKLNKEKPDIVLLGDSTLQTGVDRTLLSELMGRKISKFDIQGSASAYWYLVLKNNIVVAKQLPKVVVIIFRDTILTAPGFRVHGGYFVQLDEYADEHESLLLERSYLNFMNPLEKWSEQYFPLYGARGQIRQETDGLIRYSLPGWLGCDRDCTEYSLYEVFTSADMEPGQLQNAVAAAETYLYTSSQLNFERQVNKSYLAEMIRLTKDNGIQLVLVRLKNETLSKGNLETRAVKTYMNDLFEYLHTQNVLFLDYGTDSRLKNEHFNDSLHLNPDGKRIFTEMLADGLSNLLK
jgi:hypothetical protein